VDLSFVFANTYLLRVPWPGPLARLGHLHAKPAVRERASEYGAVLSEYDVAALCEVFRTDDLNRMIDAWDAPQRPDAANGPGPRSALAAGGGLVTLARSGLIVRSRSRVFAGQGSKLRDSDAWSAKGVLSTEVELIGTRPNLEVISTHLIAGGDVADTARHQRATEELRFAQVAEVLLEAADVHRRGNVSLIVGDFNVQAGTAAGDRLAEMMAAAGYRDIWLDHDRGPGWTCDAVVVGEPITAPDPDDCRFCADPAAPDEDAERIDYAFLRSAPSAPPLAVRSMRRRVFPRRPGRPEYEAMPYLSDHVALHLELTIGG
jgi:endonuclease/exonuclease/phosphatase family metal-dependent hydrolase